MLGIYILLTVCVSKLNGEERATTFSSEIVASTNTEDEIKNDDVLVTNNSSDEDTSLVLNIKDGRIKGRELRTINKNLKYYAFQGIPYAEPPLEDLRFNDPVPAKSWDSILSTEEDERKCVQIGSDFTGSEDCLYVNVYTTSDIFGDAIADDNLKPVMVWVYGGGFKRGSSKIYKFGPDYFLEEDIIIVTFNYRLGVFGFLSTEDNAAPGNWGLKDQILALKWIQNNIKYFGGDPKNVTLIGQSAGAACVSYLLQTPLAQGLFHKAILQSGTSLNPWALSRKSRNVAFAMGILLDIKTTNSTYLVERLRKVETRTMHYLSNTVDIGEMIIHNPLEGLIFGPTTEPNHAKAVITKKSHSLLKYGDFNRVPLIVGFTSQESIPFVSMLEYLRPYLLTYDIFSTRLVPKDLNIESNSEKILVAFKIRHHYFAFKLIVLSNKKLIQFVTDDQFVKPIHEFALQASKWTYPIYFYRFSYEGATESKRKVAGVEHGEDLSYFWAQNGTVQQSTDEDKRTGQRLVKLWTNFAKTGNPTPETDSTLLNISWPPTNIQEMVYLDIGNNLTVSSDFTQYNIPFWTEIYSKHGQPPFDTY